MVLEILLKCNLLNTKKYDIKRNCILFEGFRIDLEHKKSKNIYMAHIEEIYQEEDYLKCKLIVFINSEYSKENYKNIFEEQSKFIIKEGYRLLAECSVLTYSHHHR